MTGAPYPVRRTAARREAVAFGGLNWSDNWRAGELSACEGLSLERYPCLSQRAGRRAAARYEAPTALYAGDMLCVVDGTRFLYGGVNEGTVRPGEKQFATVNNQIVIFPDKLRFNTVTGVLDSLEAAVSIPAGGASFTAGTLAAADGGFAGAFRAGDGVEIRGCISHPANNGFHIIRSVTAGELAFDPGVFEPGSEGGAVSVRRTVPDLEWICESGNRLWGAEGQTIYASALGDPSNFHVFDGLSTDSFAAAVGTGGAFTGCAAYGGAALFWKEDCVHKVLGNFPAQYEIYTYRIPGVQAGSGKSLAVINEVLYYKGRDGVYAYDGGTPELVSGCFGQRRFYDAAAGNGGGRYVVSMRDEAGEWGLYVYAPGGPARGRWVREDGTHALGFAALDGAFYYLDADSGTVVLSGQKGDEGGRIAWSATLCPFYEGTLGRKGYRRLYLRAELAERAWVRVECSEDGGPFRPVWASHDSRAGTAVIPLLPGRCDRFQIRISGRGGCLLRSLEREFSVGSER